jgi:hypothetical protein
MQNIQTEKPHENTPPKQEEFINNNQDNPEPENAVVMKDAYGSLSPHQVDEEKENQITQPEASSPGHQRQHEMDPEQMNLAQNIHLDELESVAILYDEIRNIHK